MEQKGPQRIHLLIVLSFVLMIAALCLVFLYAPEESTMGNVQRIFYFHVALAWTGFLAFFVVFVCSIAYLWKGTCGWDHVAHGSTEIGLVLTTLMLITGPIWAKSAWGVWWTWDAKLTAALILWLVYLTYLMVRSFATSESQGATFAAVIGIVGFINVPVIFLTVQWWNTQHPPAVIFESGGLTAAMRVTQFFCFATFVVLYVLLLKRRLAIRRSEADLKRLRDIAELGRR